MDRERKEREKERAKGKRGGKRVNMWKGDCKRRRQIKGSQQRISSNPKKEKENKREKESGEGRSDKKGSRAPHHLPLCVSFSVLLEEEASQKTKKHQTVMTSSHPHNSFYRQSRSGSQTRPKERDSNVEDECCQSQTGPAALFLANNFRRWCHYS